MGEGLCEQPETNTPTMHFSFARFHSWSRADKRRSEALTSLTYGFRSCGFAFIDTKYLS